MRRPLPSVSAVRVSLTVMTAQPTAVASGWLWPEDFLTRRLVGVPGNDREPHTMLLLLDQAYHTRAALEVSSRGTKPYRSPAAWRCSASFTAGADGGAFHSRKTSPPVRPVTK